MLTFRIHFINDKTHLVTTDHARFDIYVSDMRAQLSYARLSSQNLEQIDLEHGTLDNADLESSWLDGADMRYCNLYEACCNGACMSNVNFRYSDVRYADFSHADLTNSDFRFVDIRAATFSGAKLSKIKVDATTTMTNRQRQFFLPERKGNLLNG